MRGFVEIAEYQRVCEERDVLKEELAYERSERRGGMDETTRLRVALGVPLAVAAMLLTLRRGGPVARENLLDSLPRPQGRDSDRQPNLVDVYACRIRRLLGNETLRTIWGFGYQLTPDGIAAVERALRTSATERAA